MKIIAVFCCFLIIGFSLRISAVHEYEQMVGAYQEQDVSNLGDDLKAIDTYLKNLFPDLQNSKLTQAQTQVVEGINYKYTYDLNNKPNTRIVFTVWDIPWLSKRQITEAKRIFEVRGPNTQQVEGTVIHPKDDDYSEIKKLFE